MDLNLPQMSGTECIQRFNGLLPATQVIVLTVYGDSEHISRALKAGARGHLLNFHWISGMSSIRNEFARQSSKTMIPFLALAA